MTNGLKTVSKPLNWFDLMWGKEHLSVAVTLDRNYSAAWKLLGKAQSASGDPDAAIQSYKDGIRIAQDNGDRQAAKEMTVFLRRLEKGKST